MAKHSFSRTRRFAESGVGRVLRRLRHAPDAAVAEMFHELPGWRVAAVAAGPLLALLCMWLAEQHADGLGRDGRVMLGVFALTAWYWTTNAIPPFATAIAAMSLMAFLLGLPAGTDTSSSVEGWQDFIAPAAAPVIVLMLGGFTLGHAVHKLGIDRQLARTFLKPFARGPRMLVLGVLLVTGWMSMWISNTATAAMMITLVAPIVAQLELATKGRSKLAAAIVLAVPVGANVGGMGTPIGTPPNAIAFGAIRASETAPDVTFLSWMVFALPVALVMLLVSWVFLVRGVGSQDAEAIETLDFGSARGKPSLRRAVVYGSFIVTAGLWITSPWTGVPIAAAALVPIMLLTVFGVLTRHDINALDWDILLLIAGGLALGQGMQLTGLAEWMIAAIPTGGMPGPVLLGVLCGGTLALSTFMSNTAVANLAMPIAMGIAVATGGAEIGELGAGVSVALGASLAMALPVSTPPNAIAYASGSVKTTDFVRIGLLIAAVGVPLSALVATLV